MPDEKMSFFRYLDCGYMYYSTGCNYSLEFLCKNIVWNLLEYKEQTLNMALLQNSTKAQYYFFSLLLCVFYSPFISAADIFHSIEWNELQAKDWYPPIIQPDISSDHSAHHVEPKSLVSSLDNQKIRIPGYLIPIKYKKNVISEFILVPFLEHHVKIHMHHESNQMIYVSLAKGFPVQNRYVPVLVEGTLTLSVTQTEEGPIGYFLSNAKATIYEY